MKIILFLCICLGTFSNSDVHEFYLSVTDIEYVKGQQSIQIISRVFTDDFEEVINKRYQKNFKLIPHLEVEAIDTYIEKYITEKFLLSIQGEDLAIDYLGRKYEDDMVYLFLEVKDIYNLNSITIQNLILTDLFLDQKNMIHFKSKDFKKSFILEKEQSQKTINLN